MTDPEDYEQDEEVSVPTEDWDDEEDDEEFLK